MKNHPNPHQKPRGYDLEKLQRCKPALGIKKKHLKHVPWVDIIPKNYRTTVWTNQKKEGKLGLQVDSHPSPFTSHSISAKFCQGTMDASKKGLAVSGGDKPSSPRKPHRNWMVPSHITHWLIWVPYGCFLKWWYLQNTPKWSFLVGKPMVVGYHHFRKDRYANWT